MRAPAALALVLLALPAPAQAPPAPRPAAAPPAAPPPALTEQVGVTLNLVDLAVLGPDGKPLRHLTRENFAVTVDGETREIRSFDAPGGARPAPLPSAAPAPATAPAPGESAGPTAPAAPAAAAARWILFAFDMDVIDPVSRDTAIATAEKLVDAARAEDRLAVAVIHGGTSRIVHPFTPQGQFDRGVFGALGIASGASDSIAQRAREMVRNVATCGTNTDSSQCILTSSAEFVQVSRQQNKQSLSALASLASALAPLPGRKALVLFGDGYVLTPGTVVLDAAERLLRNSRGVATRLLDQPDWNYELFLTAANRAHVSIFPVRTGQSLLNAMQGAESDIGFTGTTSTSDPFLSLARDIGSSLQRAADSSAGRVLPLGAGPAGSGALLEQLDGVYTLGLAPVPGDSIRSKLKIRLVGVKGKVIAPDRLVRRPDRMAALDGALDVVGDGAAGTHALELRLDLRNVGLEKGADGEPGVSRVAIYWRALGADGATVADDYAVVQIARPPDGPPKFRWPLPSAAAGGRVVQLNVADLVGRGTLTLSKIIDTE